MSFARSPLTSSVLANWLSPYLASSSRALCVSGSGSKDPDGRRSLSLGGVGEVVQARIAVQHRLRAVSGIGSRLMRHVEGARELGAYEGSENQRGGGSPPGRRPDAPDRHAVLQ